METLFQLSSLLVMPFWGLMIFLPRWRRTAQILSSPWIVAPAAALYVALALPGVGDLFGQLANPSLDGISQVLATPAGATIGWVHFLAFDLFVGRWVYLDGRERAISPWLISPILFFVLMLGPLGLLAYLSLRRFMSP